ncbi:MAG: hypothetical protein A2V83_09530 [Nitrospirae bacterium RBG_16_64_22]|nr:MAG: hypothetical protein A2V83_09530 [Nitrospirae bacterium RBG_16_64_22]
MLKTVRSVAIDNPWCLRLAMVAIAVTFVITMGWWGFDRPDKNGEAVADVGGDRISWEEYQDSYESLRRAAQAQMGDKWSEEMEKALNLRRIALDRLVTGRLWEIAAREAQIRVSDEEVAGLVRGQPAFRGKNGGFDGDAYLAFLRNQRKTPAGFEEEVRNGLKVERMQQIVRSAVDVTEQEVREAYEKRLGSKGSEADFQKQKEILFLLARMEKQEQALAAYLGARRRLTPITVREERIK